MESTWEPRDLPVLTAIVEALDEPSVYVLSVRDVAERTGMDAEIVYRACRALSPTYIDFEEVMAGGNPNPHHIMGVSDEARRAAGQWPSPQVWADRLVAALAEAAEREADEAKKSKLRSAAQALGGFGRDVLVEVMAAGMTAGMR